ncbi:MAG TPA: carboxypeptidase-like regulatory domain-containing protein, partial [Terriglobia bacterium]|nr:carboxypeptidase-like regulatory domain-containing protein [Terriglobia bacterium]
RKRVEIAVKPLATVTVRVVDTDGKPIEDALVRLPAVVWADGRRVLREASRLFHESGERGVFRIGNVPAGEYYLRIENPAAIAPRPGEDPLPMITYYPGVTDFQLATRVMVRGQSIDLGEVRLVRQKVFKVSGAIVRPGLNAASANSRTTLQFYVRFHDTGSPEDVFPLGRPQAITFANTQEARFEIGGLPTGTHSIYPSLMVAGVPVAFETPKIIVTIRDHDLDGLRIVLPESVNAIGRVVVDGDAPNLLRGTRLSLRTSEAIRSESLPVAAQRMLVGRTIALDSRSGEFVLRNLSEGIRYNLMVNELPTGGYVHDLRLNNLSVFDEGSFVASSGEQRLELEIRTKGGIVAGEVRDAMNQLVEEAAVVLVPEAPRRGNSFLYKRTAADASGKFTFTGVAPGDYRVLALRVAPPTGAEEDPEYLMPFIGRGTAVRTTQGTTSDVQLRVIEPQ